MVDNQVGVFHQCGVVGFGADAIRLLNEHTVPGVDASAHDKVSSHGSLSVGGSTQNNASAGVGVAIQPLSHGLGFVNIHDM